MSTWVRSRAWAFSKVTSWSSMLWPISRKWLRTVSPMGMVWRVAPMRSARSAALFLVRSVVPKQGMVTAMMSLAGRWSIPMARAVISRARVLSRPPERPTTAVFAPVCSSRFFRPRAAMVRISSHRPARSASFSGIKGVGETYRVSLVSQGVNSAQAWETAPLRPSWNSYAGGKVVRRRRS